MILKFQYKAGKTCRKLFEQDVLSILKKMKEHSFWFFLKTVYKCHRSLMKHILYACDFSWDTENVNWKCKLSPGLRTYPSQYWPYSLASLRTSFIFLMTLFFLQLSIFVWRGFPSSSIYSSLVIYFCYVNITSHCI